LGVTQLRESTDQILLEEYFYSARLIGFTFQGLRDQYASTNEVINRANNNTCIQNLRNMLTNFANLNGDRIGNCSQEYYRNVEAATVANNNQINFYQQFANVLSILFVTEIQGGTVTNDLQIVIVRINSLLAIIRNMFEIRLPEVQITMVSDLQRLFRNLNSNLSVCSTDNLNNFRSDAKFIEDGIRNVCGQEES
jgi:hypothetical protein